MGTRPVVIPDTEVQYVPDEDVVYTPLKKQIGTQGPPSLLNRVTGGANRFAESALSAAGLPTSLADIPRWGKQMFTGNAFQPYIEAGKKSPVGYVPLIGPNVVRAAEQMGEGDYLGTVGTLAGTVAPFVGAPKAAAGVRPLKEAVAEATRTETGELRPIVREAPGVVGGAVGYATERWPGMVIGGAGGRWLGPSLLDAILPERPPSPYWPKNIIESPSFEPFKPSASVARSMRYGGGTESGGGVSASRAMPVRRTPYAPGGATSFPGSPEEASPMPSRQYQTAGQQPELPSSESPLVVPEPYRPRILAESTPRGDLLDLARGGFEGAGEQMGRLGQPVIYTPRGAGPSGVRERVPIESLGRSTPFGGAMSSGERRIATGVSPTGAERRTLPFGNLEGPSPTRGAMMRNLQQIVDDPTAPERDRAIAGAQLDELRNIVARSPADVVPVDRYGEAPAPRVPTDTLAERMAVPLPNTQNLGWDKPQRAEVPIPLGGEKPKKIPRYTLSEKMRNIRAHTREKL